MLRLLVSLAILECLVVTAKQSESLTARACKLKPSLSFCSELGKRRDERKSGDQEELVIPPPLPKEFLSKQIKQRDVTSNMDTELNSADKRTKQPRLTPEQAKALQAKCARFSRIIYENCQPKKMAKQNIPRCTAYFRDCNQFIQRGDPLDAVMNSFSSSVGLNIGVGVNGIPYYPINEEGGVGVDLGLKVPFGAWGGGFGNSVGVRDYWNNYQEAGANWIDGKYGYKNGWSVPLVQSLGVEGGQHNVVSVPLRGKNAGTVMVDNGYNVGGYYGHNYHVGVDPKSGNFQNTFEVGAPLAGAGFNTGQAVAWPGLDVWERALGRK